MCTFSLGLRGLTPSRAARSAVVNFPNPVNVIVSRALSASVTQSRNASTAAPASRLDRLLFDATASTNSCFVTCHSSWSWDGRKPAGTLTAASDWLNDAGLRHFYPPGRVLLPDIGAADGRRGARARPLRPPRGRRHRRRFAPRDRLRG